MTPTHTPNMHTPSPWQCFKRGMGDMTITSETKDVAEVLTFHDAEDGAESQANARLIAAAPDLLAALEAIVSTYRTFRNVPKDEQEWTDLDEAALEMGFKALAAVKGA